VQLTIGRPVTAVRVSGVSSLIVGTSSRLTAHIEPTNATNPSVRWESSNSAIATVDATGNVRAVRTGTVTIRAISLCSGVVGTRNITVVLPAPNRVRITPSDDFVMSLNTMSQLTATITPTNASPRTLAWTSSNTRAVTVDANGVVRAVGVGTATITVRTANGRTDTVTITVPPPPLNIPIPPSPPTNLRFTDITRSRATLHWNAPSFGDIVSYRVYRVDVDRNRVVFVGERARQFRSLNITDLNFGSLYSFFVVAVDRNQLTSQSDDAHVMTSFSTPTRVTIENRPSRNTMDPETYHASLTARVSPSASANQFVIWESASPDVAVVGPFCGTLIAISPGTTRIFARTVEGIYGSFTLTVTRPSFWARTWDVISHPAFILGLTLVLLACLVTVLTLGAGAPLIGAAGAWLGVSTAAITAGLLTAAAICALYGLNFGIYGATGTNVAHNLMGDTVWYDIWNILGIAAIVICAAFVIACVAYIAWAALFAPKKAEQIQQTSQITSNNAQQAVQRNAAQRVANAPASRSLTNFQARDWYVENVRNIGNNLNTSNSLQDQAKQAFNMRNTFLHQARDAMIDTNLAQNLKPSSTWNEIVQRYVDRGFSGDALWQEIINSSMRTNPSVNAIFGIN